MPSSAALSRNVLIPLGAGSGLYNAKDVDDADPFLLAKSMSVLTLMGAETGTGAGKVVFS